MTPLEWLLASLVVGLALAMWRQVEDTAKARETLHETEEEVATLEFVLAEVRHEYHQSVARLPASEVILTPEAHPGN